MSADRGVGYLCWSGVEQAARRMSMPPRHLRIGTRGSPMALRQTALVRDRLVAAHPELAANGAVEIVTIRTTGDRVQDRLLAEIGGKGLFVKEIEEALIDTNVLVSGLLSLPQAKRR